MHQRYSGGGIRTRDLRVMSPCRGFVGARWSSTAPANSRMGSDRVGLGSVGYVAPGVAPLPASLGSDRRRHSGASPCPQLPSGSLSLNTAQLPDGAHMLTLLVTNAATQQACRARWSSSITTARRRPRA